MLLTRRLVAALSSVLLLQLTLVGSGTLCAMHHAVMDARGATGHESHMIPMTSERTPASGSSMSEPGRGDTPGIPHGCDALDSGQGCGLPWSPGQCTSMSSCTATAAQSAPSIVVVASSAPVVELPEPGLLHSGFAAAPELPPPRA